MFAASVIANRQWRDDIDLCKGVRHTAFLVSAENAFEAEGKAMAVARKFYPSANGFYGWDVVVESCECDVENVKAVSV